MWVYLPGLRAYLPGLRVYLPGLCVGGANAMYEAGQAAPWPPEGPEAPRGPWGPGGWVGVGDPDLPFVTKHE